MVGVGDEATVVVDGDFAECYFPDQPLKFTFEKFPGGLLKIDSYPGREPLRRSSIARLSYTCRFCRTSNSDSPLAHRSACPPMRSSTADANSSTANLVS